MDYETENALGNLDRQMRDMRYDFESRIDNLENNLTSDIRQNYSDLSQSINSLSERIMLLEDRIEDTKVVG